MNLSQSAIDGANQTSVNNTNNNGASGSVLENDSLSSRRTQHSHDTQMTGTNPSIISEGRWEWLETEIDYLKSLLNINQSLLKLNINKLYQLISGSCKKDEILDPFDLKHFHLYRENSLLLHLILFTHLNDCKKEKIVNEFINKLAVKIRNCINNWKENHFAYEVKEGKFIIHLTKQDSVELDPKLTGSQAWLCSLFQHFIESEDFFLNMGKSMKDIQVLINHSAGTSWGKDLEEKLAIGIAPDLLQDHLITAYDNLTSFNDVSQKVKSLNIITQILQYYVKCGYTITEQLIIPILEITQSCISSEETKVCSPAINLLSQLAQIHFLPQSSLKFIIDSSLNVLKELKANLDEKWGNWQFEFQELEGECTHLGLKSAQTNHLQERCIDLKNRYHNWECQYIAWEKDLESFKHIIQSVIGLFTHLFKRTYLPNPQINSANLAIQLIEYTCPFLQANALSADILHFYFLLTQHKLFIINKNTLDQILVAVSEILSSILSVPFSITKKNYIADELQEKDRAIENALILINAFVTAALLDPQDEAFGAQVKLINTISIKSAALSGNKILPRVLDLILSLYQVGYLNKNSKKLNNQVLNQIEFKLSGTYGADIQLQALLILDFIISKQIIATLPEPIIKKIIALVDSATESLKNEARNILNKLLSLPNVPDILPILLSTTVSDEILLQILFILENLISTKQIKGKNFSSITDQLVLVAKNNTSIEAKRKALRLVEIMDKTAFAAIFTLLANTIIEQISNEESYKNLTLFNSIHSSVSSCLQCVTRRFKNEHLKTLITYFKNAFETFASDTVKIQALEMLYKLLNQYTLPTINESVLNSIETVSKTTGIANNLKNAILSLCKFLLPRDKLPPVIPESIASMLLDFYLQPNGSISNISMHHALHILRSEQSDKLTEKAFAMLEKVLNLGKPSQKVELLAVTLSEKASPAMRTKSLDILKDCVDQYMLVQHSPKTEDIQHLVLLFENTNLTLIVNILRAMLKLETPIEMLCKAIELLSLMDQAKLVIIEYMLIHNLLLLSNNMKQNLDLSRSINSILLYFLKNKDMSLEKQELRIQLFLHHLIRIYSRFDDAECRHQVLDCLNSFILKFYLLPTEDLELLFNTLVPSPKAFECLEFEEPKLKEKIISFFENLVDPNFNYHFKTHSKADSPKPQFPDIVSSVLLEKFSNALDTENIGDEFDALSNIRYLMEYLSKNVVTYASFVGMYSKMEQIDKRPNLPECHRKVINEFFWLLPRIISPDSVIKLLEEYPASVSYSSIKKAIQELNKMENPDYTILEPLIEVFANKINSQESPVIEIKDINGYVINLCLLLQKKGLPSTLKQCIFKLFIDLIPKGDSITINLIRRAVLALLDPNDLTAEIPLLWELCTQLLVGNHFEKHHQDAVKLIHGWMDILRSSQVLQPDYKCRILAFFLQAIEENQLIENNVPLADAFYDCLATFFIDPTLLILSEELLIQALKSLTVATKIVNQIDDSTGQELVAAMTNLLGSSNTEIQIHTLEALGFLLAKYSIRSTPLIFQEVLVDKLKKLINSDDLKVREHALILMMALAQ